MQNYYQFMVPRLNGDEIGKDFPYYLSLARKGIGGFIVFGGRLGEIRPYIKKLQDASELPLIIGSDLERGLGQQIRGGTLFPPAMALASAIKKDRQTEISKRKLKLLRDVFRAVADEAAYAGINTVLAPVLDINTNPKNPIIAARAFGEDSETVSFFGCEMIEALQARGIAACGKHFPGHGDTDLDSHISLPSINRGLNSLHKQELRPFKDAVAAGVKMLMLGHLRVPAIDPSGLPVSISEKAVRFIRKNMGYKGVLITDAMNMGGLGRYSEERASFMALSAGVDIILHPSDVEKIAVYLRAKKKLFKEDRLALFREGLLSSPSSQRPDLEKNSRLSGILMEKAIRLSGITRIGKPVFLLLLSDEGKEKGMVFVRKLRTKFRGLKVMLAANEQDALNLRIPDKAFIIAAVFSETRAWKGGAGSWLYRVLSGLKGRVDLYISFGSPYLLEAVSDAPKMDVYWDSESAQKAVADHLSRYG